MSQKKNPIVELDWMKNENVRSSRNVVLYTWKVISTRMQKIQKFGHRGTDERGEEG